MARGKRICTSARRALCVLALALLAVPASAGAVTITEFPLPAAAADAHRPTLLKEGGDGNLWVINPGTQSVVYRVTTTGLVVGSIPSVAPTDIAVAPSGNVYWTSTEPPAGGGIRGGVVRATPSGAVTPFLHDGFADANALAVDPAAAQETVTYTATQDSMTYSCSATFATAIFGGCGPIEGAPQGLFSRRHSLLTGDCGHPDTAPTCWSASRRVGTRSTRPSACRQGHSPTG